MTSPADEPNRFDGGQLTVLVSTTSVPLESCLDTLQASGISGTVERFEFAGDDPVVQAEIPFNHKPSAKDFEEAVQTVGHVLTSSNIAHEIRGTGFNALA